MRRCRCALIIKALGLIIFILLHHVPADADSKSTESISLEFTNQPISYALDRLSQMTGLRFIYHRDAADAVISVNIKNLDLDKALRKILNNYNYGILYGADGTVRIMIYGEKSDSPPTQANTSSPVEYGHIGSAAVQEEDPETSQDLQEKDIETNSDDASTGDRDDHLEQNEKNTDEGAETDGEPKETETGEVDDVDPEKDPQETATPETDTQ